jgi:hypothetical protein
MVEYLFNFVEVRYLSSLLRWPKKFESPRLVSPAFFDWKKSGTQKLLQTHGAMTEGRQRTIQRQIVETASQMALILQVHRMPTPPKKGDSIRVCQDQADIYLELSREALQAATLLAELADYLRKQT